MALAALLQATRDHLASKLGLEVERDISVEEDAQPPPMLGEIFYAVHPTGWNWPGATDNDVLDEEYAITVSVTRRTPVAPKDKHMEHLFLDRLFGMEKLCRGVMKFVHLNYELFALANTYCEGDEVLTEPLRWDRTDAVPETKGADWFWAEGTNVDTVYGWVMGVHFGRARRLQKVFQSLGQVDDVE